MQGAIGNNPEKFFEDLNKLVLENYRINQTSTDAKRMIDDLDKIKFALEIFSIFVIKYRWHGLCIKRRWQNKKFRN